MRRTSRVIGAALLLACASLRAHDFWIEPTTFTPDVGQSVGLRLRVGENLSGEVVPRLPELFKQFVAADAAERRAVPGRRGADPAGAIRATQPGLQIVGYLSHANYLELGADKFNAYLKDEGLEHIIELRAHHRQSDSAARELYVRCAKSLLIRGVPIAGQGDRRLGLPLELVAERNPYSSSADDLMPLRLTYEDRPLAGALVVALNRLHPFEKQAARTDTNGRVRLHLRPGGMWLVKAVHMVAAPSEPFDAGGAQWLSWWASLTFGSRAEPP